MSRNAHNAVRALIAVFMTGLVVSGLSAIPLTWEVVLLHRWIGVNPTVMQLWPSLSQWIELVRTGVQESYEAYPFLAYGTDWLAFGHVAIAVAFIGVLRDPLRNRWVIDFGLIACGLVIPWALIFGQVRDIPQLWTLVDMSFGIFGAIPLWLARRLLPAEGRMSVT